MSEKQDTRNSPKKHRGSILKIVATLAVSGTLIGTLMFVVNIDQSVTDNTKVTQDITTTMQGFMDSLIALPPPEITVELPAPEVRVIVPPPNVEVTLPAFPDLALYVDPESVQVVHTYKTPEGDSVVVEKFYYIPGSRVPIMPRVVPDTTRLHPLW